MRARTSIFILSVFLSFACIFVADTAQAATKKVIPKKPTLAPLEFSGWIPYWRQATGTQEALLHLATFKEINPFGYTVKQDGSLYDRSEEHTSELQSPDHLVCRLLFEKKKIHIEVAARIVRT